MWFVSLGLVLLLVVAGIVAGVTYTYCRRKRRRRQTPPHPLSNDVNGHNVNDSSEAAAVRRRLPIQTPSAVNSAATSSNRWEGVGTPHRETSSPSSPRECFRNEPLSRSSYIKMNGRPMAPFKPNPRAKDLTAWRCYENSAHSTPDTYVVAEPLDNRSRSPYSRI